MVRRLSCVSAALRFFFFLHLLSLWNVVSRINVLVANSNTVCMWLSQTCFYSQAVSWWLSSLTFPCVGDILIVIILIISYLAAAKMCFIMAMTGRGLWALSLQRDGGIWPRSFSCQEATKPTRALNFVGFLLNLCPNVSMAVLCKNLYVVSISPPGRMMKALKENFVFCLTCFISYLISHFV